MSQYSSTKSNILCGHHLHRARHRRNDFISPVREEAAGIDAALTWSTIVVPNRAYDVASIAAEVDLRINTGAAAEVVGVGTGIALKQVVVIASYAWQGGCDRESKLRGACDGEGGEVDYLGGSQSEQKLKGDE